MPNPNLITGDDHTVGNSSTPRSTSASRSEKRFRNNSLLLHVTAKNLRMGVQDLEKTKSIKVLSGLK